MSHTVLATKQNSMRGWYPCVNRLNEENILIFFVGCSTFNVRFTNYLVYVYLRKEKRLS